jgi:hypothetical protein
VLEGILEFQLLVVAAMRCIGSCGNDLACSAQLLPEFAVVELAAIGLAGGVVDVLHIGKNSNPVHDRVCR